MKQLTIVVLVLLFAIVTKAQDTLSDNKNIQANNAQAAHFDYFLKIKGVDGDDSGPDSLPPAREHLTLNGGGIMSRTRNSNFIERYSVKSKPGFTISLGYTFEFPKSRLQINAGYQKGGVSVATGDINGDGKENTTELELNYLTIPVQYQFYVGRAKRIYLGGGGYASLLLSSKETGNSIYEAGFKKFDAGFTTSAGMWLNTRLMLQAGYNYGLVDIDLSKTNSSRNGMAFVVLSYSLYSKLKYGPIIKIKPKGG